MGKRTYDDAALADAVAAARSWRDVLRRLGLKATSAAAARSVRAHAARLELDHSHFTGQRRWTEAELVAAVSGSRTWSEVLRHLGLAGGSSTAALKGHAVRLGVDTSHLSRRAAGPPAPVNLCPSLTWLPRGGAMLAAAWFAFSGYDVSWPLEPCRYDFLAVRGLEILRVQVKTTRKRSGLTWLVSLSTSSRHSRSTYDPDDIDCFFVVDGDLACYLIPIAAVGGRYGATLSGYEQYRLPSMTLTGGSSR